MLLSRTIACALACGCLLCACNRNPAAPTRSASSTPHDEVAGSARGATAEAPAGAAEVKQVPPPPVRIEAATSDDGRIVVSLQNRASSQVVLGHALELERRDGSGYERVAAEPDALSPGAAPRPPCVELASGAELRPEPWRTDKSEAERGTKPGTYRFVAQACDGSYRVLGESFELR